MDFALRRHNLSTHTDCERIYPGMSFDRLLPAPDHRASPALGLASYAAALLLVALSTVIGLAVAARWGSSPVVMLYLPPVLAAAIFAGLRPGLFAAAASTLAYNFYFTEPVHTFAIDRPADIVTVIVLFLVAVVSSQLAASVRTQARLAQQHAARNAAIAGFSRRLLSAASEAEVTELSAGQLAALFDCHAVILGPDGATAAAVPGSVMLSPSDLAAGAYTLESGEPSGRGEKRAAEADWQFHPVLSGKVAIAAAGLARSDGTPPVDEDRALLLESLLDQLALALERARLDREARDSAALRARDKLRSAWLASIGDDVKPRLREIQSAVRALRRGDGDPRALAAALDGEVTQVDRYIDNLVDLTPGAEHEPLVFGDIAIDLYRRSVRRGAEALHFTPKEFAVLAELAKHAGKTLTHAQILRAVWGPAQQDHVDYLRVAIRALRQKLEREPANPALIVNEPGVGYRLTMG